MLGFSNAARKLAPRDHFIGWTPGLREKSLPLVVDNPRFLILPWITIAAAATRLEVTDTVLARNIRASVRQCVFYALLLGHLSADDLRTSTDVWAARDRDGREPLG